MVSKPSHAETVARIDLKSIVFGRVGSNPSGRTNEYTNP